MQKKAKKLKRKRNKMAHINRQNIGKFWPIPRKGTKYLAVASYNKYGSIPLVVVARDILKIVRNKKELKRLINEKRIKINHKEIRETNYPVCLFDVINLIDIKKNYRATFSENKKMIFEEISDKESETKIFKIFNKKILSGNRVQFNLMYGKNIISKEKANTGDSILLNLKENKIIKIIKMEKGEKTFVVKGKHAGEKGKIEDIMQRGGKTIVKIISDKGKINVWIKNMIVVE
jgi:small subunit ribosomal protein S4e